MCWEIDYRFFAEKQKAQEARIKQEQRSGVINQLLSDATKQGEKNEVEGTPVKEVSPDEADPRNDFHRTQPRINATAVTGDDAGGTWTA